MFAMVIQQDQQFGIKDDLGLSPGAQTLALVVILLAVGVLTVILAVFLAFHFYVTCTGQTTKQVVRRWRAGRGAEAVSLEHFGAVFERFRTAGPRSELI
jgi:hypothetical protein